MTTTVDGRTITVGPSGYSTMASDIGLGPGIWPSRITTELDGRMMEFRRAEIVHFRGDVSAMRYMTESGMVLTVWND